MEFEYVSDAAFQDILKRDYQELKKCHENEAYKSALIMCGSILEALLVDYFSGSLPTGFTKDSLLVANLAQLLDLAERESIINKGDKNLATVLKDYRNLIHPGREVRKKELFDKSTADISVLVLESLLRKLEQKYKERFPSSAQDILINLDEDWGSRAIYGIVITKLSNIEKERLFDEFIDIEIDIKSKFENYEADKADPVYKNIEETKEFVNELKPLLPQEVILKALHRVIKAINEGESLEVLSLYNLLHEDIHLLNKDEQEFIAIYMLAHLSSIVENVEELASEKTYSTIGKYIHTDKGLREIKNFVEFGAVNFGGANLNHEIDVFEQILNSLSDDHKEKILSHLATFLRIDVGTLPIEPPFAIEVAKRGFLNYPIPSDL
jgi:hypothetical protein